MLSLKLQRCYSNSSSSISLPEWVVFLSPSSSARITTHFFPLYYYLRICQVPYMNVSSVPPLNTHSLVTQPSQWSLASTPFIIFPLPNFLGILFSTLDWSLVSPHPTLGFP